MSAAISVFRKRTAAMPGVRGRAGGDRVAQFCGLQLISRKGAMPGMVAWEVVAARGQADQRVNPIHEWRFPNGELWASFYRRRSGYLVRFPHLADFHVSREGGAVECFPVPGISEGTIQHLYLNQVLPLALSKQRKLVFHASAVELNRGAAVFLGVSGSGKSTLAASFATNGYRFLTDDGLLVEERGGGFEAHPSHPSVRLWEDSQEVLIRQAERLAPPVQYTPKARILAGDGIAFCNQPRPLRRLYFLADDGARVPVLTPMKASEALIELVRHSFLLDVEEQEMLAYHLDRLSALVREPRHYRLDYPRRFDALPAVRSAILKNAALEEATQ